MILKNQHSIELTYITYFKIEKEEKIANAHLIRQRNTKKFINIPKNNNIGDKMQSLPCKVLKKPIRSWWNVPGENHHFMINNGGVGGVSLPNIALITLGRIV